MPIPLVVGARVLLYRYREEFFYSLIFEGKCFGGIIQGSGGLVQMACTFTLEVLLFNLKL